MEKEEIEEAYNQDIEKARKEFLEGAKKNQDCKKLRSRFKKNLEKARDNYYKLMSKNIRKEKKELSKVRIKKEKKEKIKPFKAKGADMRLSRFQRFKYWWQVKKFRLKIKIRHAFNKIYHPHISYYYIKTKKGVKRAVGSIAYGIKVTFLSIISLFKKIFIFIIKVIKFIYTKISGLIKITFRILIFWKKKKPKEKKAEKSEKDKETNSDQNK